MIIKKRTRAITAYKVFGPDWKCRDMLYEVGQTYEHNGLVRLCESGYHACLRLQNCFNYYAFDPSNKVARVKVYGTVKGEMGGDKIVASCITIVEEITWPQVLAMCNTGRNNTGRNNTGDSNTGDYNEGESNTGAKNIGNFNTGDNNTGNRNTGGHNKGHYNTGNYNTGVYNTGHYNTGGLNTGSFNTGSHNAGNYNAGHRNTGHYNTGNYNTGYFCTGTPEVVLFDKPAPGFRRCDVPLVTLDINRYNGHYHVAWAAVWKEMSEIERLKFLTLPNFDPYKFERITGLKKWRDY